MTRYLDSFLPVSAAQAEPLSGRLTPTGGATWATAKATAVVQRDGSGGAFASLPAAEFAWLDIGAGDIDVTVTGARLAVRAQSPTGKRYELRTAAQTNSGGYYSTENYYQQTYGGRCTYGAGSTSFTYLYQCGNANFPATGPRAGCSDGSTTSTTKFGPANAFSTCQVYRTYSYTVFSAQLWVIDSQGREAAVGNVQTVNGSDSAQLRLRAEADVVTAWVDGVQVAQVSDPDTISRSRNRVLLGRPDAACTYRTFNADTLNTTPNAPQTSAPSTNRVLDRTIVNRLAWLFNDPDAGDMQSAFELRYRVVGASDWVSVTGETTSTFYDVAPGTFEDGARYEWQVRTTDRGGLTGPFSAVDYYRAADPPPAPVWLQPSDGGTIPTQLYAATWSASSQVAYQVRIDSDTETVSDTGRIPSTERGMTLQFPTNRVDRYLSVRIESGELWSPWAVVKVRVFYTPPAVTLLELTPFDDDGCIHVQLRVPKPRGTQPTVIRQDLYRVEGDGPEYLVARNLIGDALWIDWTPASGVNNRYRVIAYGDNGTTSDSGLVDTSTALPIVILPGAYSADYLTTY